MNKARWFLDEMVKGAYEDWRRDQLSERRVRCVTGFVNDMAEWAYHHLSLESSFKSAIAYRSHMTQAHREFRIVADVANGTKHVVLSSGKQSVTNAEQTRLHQHESIDSVVDFDSIEDFDSLSEWIVELDTGSREALGPLLRTSIQMWESLLIEKGV